MTTVQKNPVGVVHVWSVERQGYTITEEAQSLIDDQLGGCLPYLAVGAA